MAGRGTLAGAAPCTVSSVMSSRVITVDVGVSLSQAAERMREAGTHHLLLTDRDHAVALVSATVT